MMDQSTISSPAPVFNLDAGRGKRLRVSSPEQADQFKASLTKMRNDDQCPSSVKDVLFAMVDKFDVISDLLLENQQLKAENSALKSQLATLSVSSDSVPNISVPTVPVSNVHNAVPNSKENGCFEVVERSRAVVISGVYESKNPNPVKRAEEDMFNVKCVVNTLGVEAVPVTVYRMGRVGPRPRLLKVIMPSSTHQKRLVERSSYLRNSEFKGVWLRASLTYEDRVKQREERLKTNPRRGPAGQSGPTGANAYGNPSGAFSSRVGIQAGATAYPRATSLTGNVY